MTRRRGCIERGMMWKYENKRPEGGEGEPTSENTWLHRHPSSKAYKLAALAQLTQSVLNAAACLIIVSLTHLWSVLHTRFLLPVWKSYFDWLFVSSTIVQQEESEYNSKMTIEVPVSPPPSHQTTALPVLRINSVNIDDPLLDSSRFLMSPSSSDGEDQDQEVVYNTDSELSSSNEGQLVRRDSDTSDVSSTDGSQEEFNETAPEVASKIIAQVETMFSDDHLAKDGFLLKHVRRRSDGFVSLKLVAGLRKVKQISRDFPVVMSALRKSSKLEVNSEGTKIRRLESLPVVLKTLPIASQNNKEKLSKSPSSSGDDLPNRNVNGTCLHFSYGYPTANEKENRKGQYGRNIKVTRNNSKDFGQVPHQQQQQQHNNKQVRNYNNKNYDEQVVLRRRGGSLPISVGPESMHPSQRPLSSYLSPGSSPPNFLPQRPKSNSYCEGLMTTATMSPWLQRRKAATSRTNSEGNVIISGVVRQPKGPDGTRGFSMASRFLIRAN